MSRSKRRWRGLSALMLTACVAALALAAAGIRSGMRFRAATDRALSRYADIAAWELADNAGDVLDVALRATLWPATRFGVVDASGFPPVGVLAGETAESDICPCPLPIATRFYFRRDLVSHTLDVVGEILSPQLEAGLAELLDGVGAGAVGRATLASWAASPGGEYLALTTLPDRDGVPTAVYGAAISPAALVPVFRQALDSAAILPASVLPAGIADDVFLVSVRDARGAPLFSLAEGVPSKYGAEGALGEALGGLRVSVRLSEAGSAALAGGSPTPTWLVLALLMGVVALLAGVFRSVSRERDLLDTQRRFVASVSHDLRTPLTQIRMYAETLRLGRTRNPGDAQTYLGYIDEEAHRLSHLIENVLILQSTGRPRASNAAVDLGTLAGEEVERFRHLAGSERVSFEVTREDHTWVEAPTTVVRRVLANLLDNAVKYGPADQTVAIRVSGNGAWASLAVEDQGPGIPARDRARVFEPFERLAAEDTRGTPGSGVGLTVVRDLVESLGGSVRIEDGATGGTAVIVELPSGSRDGGEGG